MTNQHEQYKDEKIKENSVLINRFSKDNNKSLSLEKSIISLQTRSKILNNEISRIRNDNSSIITSINASKEKYPVPRSYFTALEIKGIKKSLFTSSFCVL